MFFLLNNDMTQYLAHEFVNKIYKMNNFYKQKYATFVRAYGNCTASNFQYLPYLTKDELIQYNDSMITPPYKKCDLICKPSCISDPALYTPNCAIGQSTGGTSGKSTFIWMNKQDAYQYIYTFFESFKKNGYTYGDKIMTFYPSKSYFTDEYERHNWYLLFGNVYFLSFTTIDKETTIQFVDSINTNHPDLIVIFPFVLLQLCINIKRYNLVLTYYPKNINLSGEYLLSCSLHFCKDIFHHSNIETTYGAVEFGEIAHQVKHMKNTYEVFNKFCYLENYDDKIVVTSFINTTFPIIRYVMEDIGTIINKDGTQYITNLVGKNTNQIQLRGSTFTSLNVDDLIETVNIDHNIIAIVITYDNVLIDINYIVYTDYNQNDKNTITVKTIQYMHSYFNTVQIYVTFTTNYRHNYLKKFKIIVKRNNIDSEPVGGFFRPS